MNKQLELYLRDNFCNTSVYTTGAHLSPMRVGNVWMWVVNEFDEATYYQGDSVDLATTAITSVGLVRKMDEEDAS